MRLVHFLDTEMGKNYLVYSKHSRQDRVIYRKRRTIGIVSMTSAVGYNKAYTYRNAKYTKRWNYERNAFLGLVVDLVEGVDVFININIEETQYIYELDDDELLTVVMETV